LIAFEVATAAVLALVPDRTLILFPDGHVLLTSGRLP
jgi:hypothetical protein